MALIDCPHCLNEVLPMADGECPSCGGDTRQDAAREWAKLRVSENTRFPSMCCTCEQTTSEFEVLHGETHKAEPIWVRAMAVVGIAAFGRFRWLANDAIKGDEVVFSISIPHCEECKSNEPLIPEHINLEQRTMTLVVRHAFKQLVEDGA